MREISRLVYWGIMDLKYKFNANEFAQLNGISLSALRKRRLSGKLNGQFIKKGSVYFYRFREAIRPNNKDFTIHGSRSKVRRRMVHGSKTNYHKVRNGHQFKLTNDLRQLARINKRLNEEQIAEITEDIFDIAKQRRAERIKKQLNEQDYKIKQKNYGFIFNPNRSNNFKDIKINWRPLFPEVKDEYDRYEPIENKQSKYYEI